MHLEHQKPADSNAKVSNAFGAMPIGYPKNGVAK
jgi:hypothetical protein